MSLTSFIKEPDVRAMLKPLRPAIPRALEAPLIAQPRSKRTQIVGIGFDYLFRFEVQRRFSQVRVQPWVADNAPMMLRHANVLAGGIWVLEPGNPPMPGKPPGGFARTARKVDQLLDEIHSAVDAHVAARESTKIDLPSMAASAMKLAKLDLVHRAHTLDLGYATAHPDDVDDLMAMIQLVPWDDLVSEGRILLNPTFGHAGAAVGGADADLIWGDLLVDLKSTKDDRIKPEHLDQILGYFLLARRHRKNQRRFPLLKRAGVYFARRGYLLTFPVEIWTTHPSFNLVEKAFFERAGAVA